MASNTEHNKILIHVDPVYHLEITYHKQKYETVIIYDPVWPRPQPLPQIVTLANHHTCWSCDRAAPVSEPAGINTPQIAPTTGQRLQLATLPFY